MTFRPSLPVIRLVLLVFLGLAVLVPAASAGHDGQRPGPDPIPADRYMAGRFTMERHLGGFATPLVSHGRFFLAPAIGLAWLTDTPFPDVLVLDRRGITRFPAPDRPERLAGGDRLRVVTDMIAGVLAGDWARLDTAFSVDLAKTAPDLPSWRATLVPAADGPLASQITRITAEGGAVVTTVTLDKPGGDRDVLHLDAQALFPLPLPAEVSVLFDAAAAASAAETTPR